jgi:hypothetical protein
VGPYRARYRVYSAASSKSIEWGHGYALVSAPCWRCWRWRSLVLELVVVVVLVVVVAWYSVWRGI